MTVPTPLRIVIAEDSAPVRDAITALLDGAEDMSVVAAVATAREAIAACRARSPDVAVLDMVMPGDGLVAAKAITDEDGQHTRVVILTAHDTPEARQAAFDNGAVRFVVKSDGEDLVGVVRAVADR